jgi:outer membrane protein OmpA-like peptidoglycan-associated protein
MTVPHRAFIHGRRAAIVFALATLLGCQSAPPAASPQARVQTLQRLGFVAAPDGQWELDLGIKLLFDSDSAELSVSGRTSLARLARELRDAGIARMRVDGHTDDQGSARYNAALSLRRADAVARLLAENGWQGSTLERQGLGAQRPVADNTTAQGRAQNRRVVLTVSIE